MFLTTAYFPRKATNRTYRPPGRRPRPDPVGERRLDLVEEELPSEVHDPFEEAHLEPDERRERDVEDGEECGDEHHKERVEEHDGESAVPRRATDVLWLEHRRVVRIERHRFAVASRGMEGLQRIVLCKETNLEERLGLYGMFEPETIFVLYRCYFYRTVPTIP